MLYVYHMYIPPVVIQVGVGVHSIHIKGPGYSKGEGVRKRVLRETEAICHGEGEVVRASYGEGTQMGVRQEEQRSFNFRACRQAAVYTFSLLHSSEER